MKRILLHILIAVSVGFPVLAKDSKKKESSKLEDYMESGAEIDGIRAPYYDDEGTLKAHLYGGRARIINISEADVTNLRIDVYDDGKVFMTLFAPQCFTKMGDRDGKKFLEVYSDGEVLIDLEQMTIIGRGFRFTSTKNKFEILHDSKVLVKESARDMKGVEL